MSDADPNANETPPATTASTEEKPTFAPITSQEEFDRALGARLHAERSKYADYDDLKGKAAEFDKLADAQKTELQRATDEATAAKQQAQELGLKLLDQSLRNAVVTGAVGKGIVDPDAAYALLDRSAVQYDDNGNATNVGDLLDALVKAKPYLVGAGKATPKPLPGGGQEPDTAFSMDALIRGGRRRSL